MRAIVKTAAGPGHLELQDWPEPKAALDEVKLKIAAAGICGTDIHIIQGHWPCRPPVVIGHEFCGTVVEVGSLVSDFKPGDRVVASNPAQTCGRCYHCRAGNPFMCNQRISAGYMIDGAFAEYLCIRAERCHHLPGNISFRQAALGEPLAVAVHAAIERTAVHAGDLVLVSGPGCVGLLTLQIAKLEGARVVVAGTDRDTRRLALAKDLGADLIVDVTRENLGEVVRDLSNGEGADIVYECAGAPPSLSACLNAIAKEGTLAPLGIYPGAFAMDFNQLTFKELTVKGSFGYVWTSWNRGIQLLREGRICTDALISHELPLSNFAEAFRLTQDGSATKVVFLPAAE